MELASITIFWFLLFPKLFFVVQQINYCFPDFVKFFNRLQKRRVVKVKFFDMANTDLNRVNKDITIFPEVFI